MTLKEQFPDNSLNVRESLKRITKIKPLTFSSLNLLDKANLALEKHYADEFKKWHIKLALIIIGSITSVYLIILGAPRLLSLIVS